MTNREAHEEAAGMGLDTGFFEMNDIDPEAEYEETCGSAYTDLWVLLKYTIEGSEYCKQIRETNISPAFGSALCNKCIEKECSFASICVELHEMNKEDNS